MSHSAAVLDDLRARSLVQDHTDEAALRALLDDHPVRLYCGFDPTADSLHIGNLVPLLTLRRFQDFGHRPIVLAGGATGMIGDPGGRSTERSLLDPDTLRANVEAIKVQLRAFVDFDGPNAAVLVDNRDWTEPIGVLDFLRDVGKHITVNTMLAKESVRARVESDQGISFTEFSYMLLQANDFFELHRTMQCELQVGGSDQWGNITAGIEMIRRRAGVSAHGLTVPLVTTADGEKVGKSIGGAPWLDAARTLPYELHQFFVNTDDADVERFLLQLTLVPPAEVAEVMQTHQEAPEARTAQRRLADEVTGLVHGVDAVRQATLAAEAMFGGADLDGDRLAALRGIVPETSVESAALDADDAVVGLLVATGVCSSKGDARRTIDQGGVRVNGLKVGGSGDAVAALDGRYVLLQRGKKQRHLVVVDTSL